MQTQLDNEWRFIEYVILDEMSMVGLSLLARLSNIIATAKHADPIVPIGGVNLNCLVTKCSTPLYSIDPSTMIIRQP